MDSNVSLIESCKSHVLKLLEKSKVADLDPLFRQKDLKTNTWVEKDLVVLGFADFKRSLRQLKRFQKGQIRDTKLYEFLIEHFRMLLENRSDVKTRIEGEKKKLSQMVQKTHKDLYETIRSTINLEFHCRVILLLFMVNDQAEAETIPLFLPLSSWLINDPVIYSEQFNSILPTTIPEEIQFSFQFRNDELSSLTMASFSPFDLEGYKKKIEQITLKMLDHMLAHCVQCKKKVESKKDEVIICVECKCRRYCSEICKSKDRMEHRAVCKTLKTFFDKYSVSKSIFP